MLIYPSNKVMYCLELIMNKVAIELTTFLKV